MDLEIRQNAALYYRVAFGPGYQLWGTLGANVLKWERLDGSNTVSFYVDDVFVASGDGGNNALTSVRLRCDTGTNHSIAFNSFTINESNGAGGWQPYTENRCEGAEIIHVDPTAISNPSPAVINVGGVCYTKSQNSATAPDTFSVDEEFDNCDDCVNALSSSSLSSQGISSSSSSSSGGFSSSSSSLGLSSSSSSGGISSSSSSLGLSSSSSSSGGADESSSSSQSGVANACTGVTCATVNGFVDPPSVQIKVGDPGGSYAGGNITWCGETWTAAQINANNDWRCVCPSNYDNQTISTYTPSFGTISKDQKWTFANNLTLQRAYLAGLVFGSWAINRYNRLRLRNVSTDFYRSNTWVGTTLPPAGVPSVVSNDLGKVTGSLPTKNNYTLNSIFFGSHVISGVTYEWSQGLNWP
jgi:hypothetical protein